MVADAENDVQIIRFNIIANRQKAHGLDSLANLCFMFEDSDNTKKQLYRLYRTYAASSEIARFTDRTLSQLKNSGGMRLIRNKVAADSITFYDNQLKEVIGQQNVYSAFLNEAVIFSQQIFSWYYLQSDPDNRKLKSPLNSFALVELLTTDKSTLIQFGSKVEMLKSIVTLYI